MRKQLAGFCAALLSMAVAGIQVTPSVAAPIQLNQVVAPSNDASVVDVQYRDRYYRGGGRHYGGGRNYGGGRYYCGGRKYGGYYGGRRYYGGRHYGNGGAIIGGLAAGAILGGIIASQNQPVYRGGGNSHVRWCLNRYRSYDARSDTYQPYHGSRRHCNSPYR